MYSWKCNRLFRDAKDHIKGMVGMVRIAQMEIVRIAQIEIVRFAKKGNSSTISLTVELFPFFAIRTISHF